MSREKIGPLRGEMWACKIGSPCKESRLGREEGGVVYVDSASFGLWWCAQQKRSTEGVEELRASVRF